MTIPAPLAGLTSASTLPKKMNLSDSNVGALPAALMEKSAPLGL